MNAPKERGLFRVFLCLLLSIGLFWGCKERTPEAAPPREGLGALGASGSEVVARVGGTDITGAELSQTLQAYAQQLMMGGQKPPPDMEDSVLDMLIDNEILYQSGLKMDLHDVDKKVDDMVRDMEAQFPSKEVMDQMLTRAGMTTESLRTSLKKKAVVQAVVEKEIDPQAPVSEEEVKTFYEKNKKELEQPERVRAHHILLTFPKDATEVQKEEVKEKILALKKRLDAGEDFEAVARSDSSCPSKEKGGDLGFFSKGRMVPAFEEAVWSLDKGAVSGPVETRFGYHLIRKDEKKAAGTPPLEEVRAGITEVIRQQKASDKLDRLLEKLKKDIKVEKLKGGGKA